MFSSSLYDRDFYFDSICESDYKDSLLADPGYFLDLSEVPRCWKEMEVGTYAICYPVYKEV